MTVTLDPSLSFEEEEGFVGTPACADETSECGSNNFSPCIPTVPSSPSPSSTLPLCSGWREGTHGNVNETGKEGDTGIREVGGDTGKDGVEFFSRTFGEGLSLTVGRREPLRQLGVKTLRLIFHGLAVA
jgi:hypothetical protein